MGRIVHFNKSKIKAPAGCEIKGFDDDGTPVIDFAKMTAKAKDIRERFVREYFIDFNATAALLRMGYPYATAGAVAHRLWNDAYVQFYLPQYRKTIVEKSIVSRSEVFLGLLQEAKNERASATARTNAWKAIGKFLGMSVQKIEIAATGGAVMVVPLVGNGTGEAIDVTAWEKVAEGSQARLKKSVVD